MIAGEEDVFYDDRKPVVKYDSKIGRGYEEAKRYLTAGENNFGRDGKYLFLTTGDRGPVANISYLGSGR